MFSMEHQLEPSPEASQIIELYEAALAATDFDKLAEGVLPSIANITNSSTALLYVTGSQLLTPLYFQHGFKDEAASDMKQICAEQFARISNQADAQQPVLLPVASGTPAKLILYPLCNQETCTGFIGLVPNKDASLNLPPFWERLLRLITNTVSRLAHEAKSERRLTQLNAYLTVSSMLAESLGLHDILEAALYSCMDIVSAEAASVLLLDDDKKNFSFYQVEGPTKPALQTIVFPADRGIAGDVLKKLQSEVINDVRHDPRFYGKVDSESGFQTQNMIAIPIIAGEEHIGVLELLNKVGGRSFTEEDRAVLISIVEVIAFAIRNARIFEYVADSYCKQRQGQASCKGCKRPLGSWTPCVKYRGVEV